MSLRRIFAPRTNPPRSRSPLHAGNVRRRRIGRMPGSLVKPHAKQFVVLQSQATQAHSSIQEPAPFVKFVHGLLQE